VNGLFWWWPEDNGNKDVTQRWWNAALYNHDTGKPYAAFYELKQFVGAGTGIETRYFPKEGKVQNSKFKVQRNGRFTVDGRKLQGEPNEKGIYIMNGRKTVN
jgi:arabinogalactan endo-1,4-beta-galactosidase